MESEMGKTIVITGATSGFGEACARLFSQDSCKLILIGRRKGRLEKLKSELAVETHIICRDVRERNSLKNDISSIPEKFQEIDVLVNNAGLALGMGPVHQADLDQWDTMVDTNIKGLIYCTRFILPGMVERNRGHVINIGSVAGNWPYPGGNVYGASKSFVKQFSHNIRTDLFGTAIRVTIIEPGLAETEFSVVRFGGDKKKAAQFYEGTQPLTAGDIAEIVKWSMEQPPHVNINRIEVMPVCQTCGPFAINRNEK